MTQNAPPPRHLEYVLRLTAFAAGTVDIISFAKLGGTLASAMTGNLAFIGLYLSRGSIAAAIGSLSALGGFILGGALATLLSRGRPKQFALKILLGTEIFLLGGFIPLWLALPHQHSGVNADILIITLAMAMGLQSVVGKKIDLSSIPTVVFTSTLVNIVIAITEWLTGGISALPVDTRRQAISLLHYFFGALCAGFLVYVSAAAVIALPLAAIVPALFQLRPRN